MSERDLFLRMVHHLNEAAMCMRGMAQSRKDIRWLATAGVMDECVKKVKKLMVAPSISRLAVLANGFGRGNN